jgi:molybdopterin-guanine dinucleotide biosynthesis protein MobB
MSGITHTFHASFCEVLWPLLPVLGFFGRSGSGKTTLLEKVIGELARRGYRVAVLKHTRARNVETDLPGKDTRRLWEAGARIPLFWCRTASCTRTAMRGAAALGALAGIHDVDLVLVEGDKHDALPKLEVVRAACDPQPIPEITGRIAYVTDVADLPDAEGLPHFSLEDVPALADFIERQLSLTLHS